MSVWSAYEDAHLREAYGSEPLRDIASKLGRSECAVRNRIYRLGITTKRFWSEEDRALVKQAYEAAGDGKVDLPGLAQQLRRTKAEVCRVAGQMGLTNQKRDKRAGGAKDRRMFKGDEQALRRHKSEFRRAWIAENGHPRGMAGKAHSPETRRKIGMISAQKWREMTCAERTAWAEKSIKGRAAAGFTPPKVKRGTWRAGWRDVGERRFYFRSRWEANYAHYLEWLRRHGQIRSWDYEPKTFWFDKIKRGVCSYKPDFLVEEINGGVAWHEVKGWMDARSKTALRRMAKYYPDEKVIVIDGPAYRAIRMKMLGLIPGWEDAKRDSHA